MLAIIINPKSGKRAFRAQRVYLFRLLRRRHEPFTYRVTSKLPNAENLSIRFRQNGNACVFRIDDVCVAPKKYKK